MQPFFSVPLAPFYWADSLALWKNNLSSAEILYSKTDNGIRARERDRDIPKTLQTQQTVLNSNISSQ